MMVQGLRVHGDGAGSYFDRELSFSWHNRDANRGLSTLSSP